MAAPYRFVECHREAGAEPAGVDIAIATSPRNTPSLSRLMKLPKTRHWPRTFSSVASACAWFAVLSLSTTTWKHQFYNA